MTSTRKEPPVNKVPSIASHVDRVLEAFRVLDEARNNLRSALSDLEYRLHQDDPRKET